MPYDDQYRNKQIQKVETVDNYQLDNPYLSQAEQAQTDYANNNNYDQWLKDSSTPWLNRELSTARANVKNYSPFSYNYQGQLDDVMNNYLNYQDKYDISSMWDQLSNRGEFSYDLENDPVWQSYQDKYTRLGSRAMEDTLGQIAARTGGLASSYAGTAAQDTYNNYMQALSDIIPTLEQNAYNRWSQAGNDLRNNISLGLNLNQYDRQALADQLNALNTDRAFQYGVYNDDYSKLLDVLNMYNTVDSRQQGIWQAEQAGRNNNVNNYLGLGNQWLDAWQANVNKELAIADQYGNLDATNYDRWMQELAMAMSGGSGGGGGRGGSGRSSGGSDGYTYEYDPANAAAVGNAVVNMIKNGEGNKVSDLLTAAKQQGFLSSGGATGVTGFAVTDPYSGLNARNTTGPVALTDTGTNGTGGNLTAKQAAKKKRP